jgi:nitrogen fixation protein FixH
MTFELKGGHVLAVMLAFFGITITVNAAFTFYAISTFSGEDVSKPYMRGLEYNRTLAAREAQDRLGWSAQIDAARGGGSSVVVTVKISATGGIPKAGLAVRATLRRPTDASLDRTIVLNAVEPGTYRADVKDVSPGQWDVIASAKSSEGAVFEAERRIVLE